MGGGCPKRRLSGDLEAEAQSKRAKARSAFVLPESFPSSQARLAAAQARILEHAGEFGVDGKLLKGKLDQSAAEAWERNHRAGQRGEVDCRTIRRAQADPREPGFLNVGVSKQRGKIGQDLSPFFLPTPEGMQSFATDSGMPDGKVLPARPLELVWQAAKVMHSEVDKDGLANKAYFRRRASIYEKGDVKRRYIPSDQIAGAVLSWKNAPLVQWVPSRKFYCICYSRAAATQMAYRFLERLLQDGFNLILLGPDGHPCLDKLSPKDQRNMPEIQKALAAAYIDTGKQFGHERVLVAMLLGIEPWKDAADPTGEMALCS